MARWLLGASMTMPLPTPTIGAASGECGGINSLKAAWLCRGDACKKVDAGLGDIGAVATPKSPETMVRGDVGARIAGEHVTPDANEVASVGL